MEWRWINEKGRWSGRNSGTIAERVAAGFEEVAGAADGLQEAGIFGVHFDFLAQAADANVNAPWCDELFVAPDRGEEFLASEDAAGVRSEVIEKPEFEKAGGDGFVGAGDAAGAEIDPQLVEFEKLTAFGERLGAPEENFHAGDEFARAEGLGDVIIGARFEGRDEVGFAAAGREHDDGQTVEQEVPANFGKKPEPGNVRAHGIEEQEMWWSLFDGSET